MVELVVRSETTAVTTEIAPAQVTAMESIVKSAHVDLTFAWTGEPANILMEIVFAHRVIMERGAKYTLVSTKCIIPQ